MDNITNSLSQLTSGSFAGAYKGIKGLMKELGGAESVLGKFAEQMDIPVVSWILSILDILKDGLSNLIGGLIDGIFTAVNGIISDILSGDLFVTIIGSIGKGIVDLVKSIVTLGGALSFWGNESDPELQYDLDQLVASNERLEGALDRLSDKMEDTAMAEASDVYNEQLQNVSDREKNTQESMQREGAAWSNSGYGWLGMGGKGSSNGKIDENINTSEWDKISEIVGRDINSAADFWGLSSEDMAKVADEAGGIYDKIKGYADDGHNDAAKYMDEYIAYAEEREELEKAYYEKLTNTSFDSVRDGFKSTLMNMESDAEDFAKSFEKMMQDAIIESMMTETYDKRLKDWYKNFGEAMSDGEITTDEQEELNNEYNSIVNDATDERNALADAMGWEGEEGSDREASAKGIATASQDSVDENNGRLTAIQGHTYNISEKITEIAGYMAGFGNITNSTSNHTVEAEEKTAPDYVSILVKSNENILNCLYDIKGDTSHLVQMQRDMSELKDSIDNINLKGITIKK